MRKIIITLCLLLTSLTAQSANPFEKFTNVQTGITANQYLPMDEAFNLNPTLTPDKKILVSWQIAPGYYLFKNAIHIESSTLTLNIPPLPEGIEKSDEILGTYQVYPDNIQIPVTISGSPTTGEIEISYQGCAKAGFCYPPTIKRWQVDLANNTISLLGSQAAPENAVTHTNSYFDQHSIAIVLMLFFGLGLLLSFTPCVLPMVPIIAAILVGQGNALTRQKAFVLCLIYWLSTAVTYSIAGVITALAGKSVQAFLQNPWVVGATALILVALALSLFGLYELRLPQAIQQKIQDVSTRQRRGTYVGVAVMGVLSALVVSPCITAPLLGALTYIATTGNVVIGGSALFLLGLGIGFPLFLIGTFGISLLPKAGSWMRYVQYFLGLLLIALALYIVRPFIPYFAPVTSQSVAAIAHTNVHSMAELNAELLKAKEAHKPVMIDFYATWCTSCLVLEHTVFQQPQVIEKLKQFTVLRVDVTQSTPQTDEIQVRFMAFAPPAFIFYDKAGNLRPSAEIVGEASAKKFMDTFDDVLK